MNRMKLPALPHKNKHNVPSMKFLVWVRRPFESSGYDEFPIKTSDLSGQITPVKPMQPRH